MMLKGKGRTIIFIANEALAQWEGTPMLELVYLNLFDYLARPNASEPIAIPNDLAVAVAITEADKAASEQKTEKAATRG
jgi:hypothetical protein